MVKAKQITYNKDDFFDMMSCETLDKMGHMQGDGIQNRRNMQVRRHRAQRGAHGDVVHGVVLTGLVLKQRHKQGFRGSY